MSNEIICPYCGHAMIWQSDFDYSEHYDEGEGIIKTYICSNKNCNCDAEFILITEKEEIIKCQ